MLKKISLPFLSTLVALSITSPLAWAQYTSPSYQVNEYLFGAGGELQTSSSSYQAQASAGALGSDVVNSTNYKAYSGFLTPNEPFLELGIDSSLVNLGTLDSGAAKTGAASFHVRAYVNSGYTVQTMSQPPKMISGAGNHTLTNMASQAASSPGTEQFGINLKANTAPTNFGANPTPQPDSTFANGQAASGYDTANQFKYNAGDVVACSGTSAPCASGSGWGLTNYVISYIANIAPLTPAGSYTMVQDLVVVATY